MLSGKHKGDIFGCVLIVREGGDHTEIRIDVGVVRRQRRRGSSNTKSKSSKSSGSRSNSIRSSGRNCIVSDSQSE